MLVIALVCLAQIVVAANFHHLTFRNTKQGSRGITSSDLQNLKSLNCRIMSTKQNRRRKQTLPTRSAVIPDLMMTETQWDASSNHGQGKRNFQTSQILNSKQKSSCAEKENHKQRSHSFGRFDEYKSQFLSPAQMVVARKHFCHFQPTHQLIISATTVHPWRGEKIKALEGYFELFLGKTKLTKKSRKRHKRSGRGARFARGGGHWRHQCPLVKNWNSGNKPQFGLSFLWHRKFSFQINMNSKKLSGIRKVVTSVMPNMGFPGCYAGDGPEKDNIGGQTVAPPNNSPKDVSFHRHGFYARKIRISAYPSVTCVNSERHEFHVGDKLIKLRGLDTLPMEQYEVDAMLTSEHIDPFVVCTTAELNRRRHRVENMSEEQRERHRARKRISGVL